MTCARAELVSDTGADVLVKVLKVRPEGDSYHQPSDSNVWNDLNICGVQYDFSVLWHLLDWHSCTHVHKCVKMTVHSDFFHLYHILSSEGGSVCHLDNTYDRLYSCHLCDKQWVNCWLIKLTEHQWSHYVDYINLIHRQSSNIARN